VQLEFFRAWLPANGEALWAVIFKASFINRVGDDIESSALIMRFLECALAAPRLGKCSAQKDLRLVGGKNGEPKFSPFSRVNRCG